MKSGADPSPFPVLSFPNSKKGTYLLLVDRESFSSRRMAKPSLDFTLYGNFLPLQLLDHGASLKDTQYDRKLLRIAFSTICLSQLV